MLTERERGILDIESRTWLHEGPKINAMRWDLDLSPTRYYQILASLLERQDALAYAPAVVNRLRRRLARLPGR